MLLTLQVGVGGGEGRGQRHRINGTDSGSYVSNLSFIKRRAQVFMCVLYGRQALLPAALALLGLTPGLTLAVVILGVRF